MNQKIIEALQALAEEVKMQAFIDGQSQAKQKLKLEWTGLFIDGRVSDENYTLIIERLK